MLAGNSSLISRGFTNYTGQGSHLQKPPFQCTEICEKETRRHLSPPASYRPWLEWKPTHQQTKIFNS